MIYNKKKTEELQSFRQENTISRIQLQLLSPEDQFNQLVRILPNGQIVGQITNSQTLNYKTLKPEKGGLFCERIFGPVQDYMCACKKIQKNKFNRYCPDCEVEYTSSRVRRYRLGFIRLAVPIAHIWYLKGRPSYIALLLDLKKKHAESIIYGKTYLFNNFNPIFNQRIHELRRDFNRNFAKLRLDANKRPFIFQLKEKRQFREMVQFIDHKGDDFWVHPKTQYGYIFDWQKRDFLKKKPFYQLPLIRDHFNLAYRGTPEYLYGMEDYLFTLPRVHGVTAIPKYKNIIANSMICYDSVRDIDIMLSGGKAFLHLFSKIDCFRFQLALFEELNQTRETLRLMFTRMKWRKLTKLELKEIKFRRQQISKHARRLKLFRTFWKTGSRPEWMFISILPILPPDLRPIIKMNNEQLAVSDINRLYQLVFHRNRNLKLTIANIYIHLGIDLTKLDDISHLPYNYQIFRFSTGIISFQQKLLQEAVDALLENGKGGSQPICGSNNRPLKSLSDILKGKKGRFRQNLLGKRVDYSARSVIVVGPNLKLHECGLPKEIAVELFQSLLIRKILRLKIVDTVVRAKQFIHYQHPLIWSLLNEIMCDHPILLNRAPTLHRLGIQAFIPKLIRGKAIILHPLVCPAFNADFDGDQMGVHLPLSVEAKSEAWSLMLSTQNLLSPATGEPILNPSQDMVLGCYYLTTINPNFYETNNFYFTEIQDICKAYANKLFHIHNFIWLKWDGTFSTNPSEKKLLEIRLKRFKKQFYETTYIQSSIQKTYVIQKTEKNHLKAIYQLKNQYIRTTVGRAIFNQKFRDQIQNSWTRYSISIL